jgi:DNA-binding response OmpR family regulator
MPAKILLVEDDPVMQRMYSNALKEAGFAVVLASDGTTVVALVRQEQPALVLMDVMMPNRNGLEALKDLKTSDDTKQVPVIMLSAHEDDTLMFNAMQEGANRYLVKSMFDPLAIIGIIKEVIEPDKNNSVAKD